MRYKLVFIAALSVMISACSDRRPDQTTMSYIDSLMTASFKANASGAVVLVAKNGVPIYRKAYGLANVELNVPNRPDHVFAIASMTKQFTAVCILQLVQQEMLSLQDDIRKYLLGYNTHGRVITIEHLLTHTNGIPNITERPDFVRQEIHEPSDEELVGCVMNDSLLFEPGSDFSYNDFGFTLAAFIVERVSGMKYSEYVQKNIFQVLGMNSTTIATREKTIPLLVTGYSWAGDMLYRPAEYFNWKWNYGMGDIVTCVDDMLKWDEALYTDKLVKRELLAKAWTSYVLTDGRKTNYGYGWAVPEYQNVQFILHAGGMPGFRSRSIRVPSKHLFVVVLSNNAASNAAFSVAQQIALYLVGKTASPRPARSLSIEQLQEYTGVYQMRHIGFRILADITQDKIYRNLTIQDTLLYSQRPGGGKTPLLNVGKDQFVLKGSNTCVQFIRDNKGQITSLETYFQPFELSPRRVEVKTDLSLPQEKKPISVDEKILKAFAGKYVFAGDHFTRVRVEGSRIYEQRIGEIFPETESRFFSMNVDITLDFTRNSNGVVTGMVVHGLGKSVAKKVE